MIIYHIGNALLAALLARKESRMTAGIVGGAASVVGSMTGATASMTMALCPFEGEGRIGCTLPGLLLPGAATGIAFRLKG